MRILTVVAILALMAVALAILLGQGPITTKWTARGPFVGWDLQRTTFWQNQWTREIPAAGTVQQYHLTVFGASPRVRDPWTQSHPHGDGLLVTRGGVRQSIPALNGVAWWRPDGTWGHAEVAFPDLAALAEELREGPGGQALFEELRARFPECRDLIDRIEREVAPEERSP